MTETGISVVIPVYNSERTVAKTLEAIQNQQVTAPIETIVVDDGSTDRTEEIVASFSGVKYVRQSNSGPATARNRGAAEAGFDIVCFTDSDCVPHADWLAKLTAPLGDSSISAVCGSYGISNPEFLLARCVQAEILFRHQKLMPDFPNSFGSYNFGVRKSAFEKAGGFDTTYRQASGEDNDLSYKFLKNGDKIFFVRDALVDHHHPTSILKYLREQFCHGFWRVKMYRKHPAMMKGDGYTFWKDSVEVLLVLLIVSGSVLSFFIPPFLYYVAALGIAFLLLLESAFALTFKLSIFEAFFYAGVMALRAFARTFGFLSGICENFFTKFQKK